MGYWEAWALAGLAGISWMLAWPRIPRHMRIPLGAYTGAYFVTYAIGAIWIGSDLEALREFMDGIWTPDFLPEPLVYWFLTFAPLLVPLWMVALFSGRNVRTSDDASAEAYPLSLTAFLLVFAGVLAYVIYGLRQAGAGDINTILAARGNTDNLYSERSNLFSGGGTVLFGAIYTTLPFLTHVAVASAIRYGGWPWRIAAIVCGMTVVITSLATLQITILVVFLFFQFAGLILLGKVKLKWHQILMGLVIIYMVLDTLNDFKHENFTFTRRLTQNVFRMPSALPFYVMMFPGFYSHAGSVLLGDLFFFPQADPGLPEKVGGFIYPDTLMVASVPAPAHVSAYADAGILNSMTYLVLIGFFILGAGTLYRRAGKHPLGHAIFVQCLVTLYYFSQATLRGGIWQSYGIVWGMAGLFLLLLVHPRIWMQLIPKPRPPQLPQRRCHPVVG